MIIMYNIIQYIIFMYRYVVWFALNIPMYIRRYVSRDNIIHRAYTVVRDMYGEYDIVMFITYM